MVAAIVHERRVASLPFYFIAGWIADDKPRELAHDDAEDQRILAGRPRLADAQTRARHPRPHARHRPPAGRHRKLRHHRKPHARPRDRAAALDQRRKGSNGHEFAALTIVLELFPYIAIDRRSLRSAAGCSPPGSGSRTAIRSKQPGASRSIPKTDKESIERIKLLTNENAQLRAELGSVKDRLETIERIVTDQPHRLAREIDSLAIDKGGNA